MSQEKKEKEKEKEINTAVPKEETQSAENATPGTISLRVVGQDGGQVLFRIKVGTPLSKLMDAYCNRMAINAKSIRFLYDGQRIGGMETPLMLNMSDHDVIDAILQQTGGAFIPV